MHPLARLGVLDVVLTARGRRILLVVVGEVSVLEGVGEILAKSAGHAAEVVRLNAVGERGG